MRRRDFLGAAAACAAGGRPGALILWEDRPTGPEANNQQSYRAVLELLGYATRILKTSQFRQPPADAGLLLAVPGGARLSAAQQEHIARHLAAGGSLIADRRQDWLAPLGFGWPGKAISVGAVSDPADPEPKLEWRGRDPVEAFTPPEGARALMLDAESSQPLAVAGRHGAGRYLYLAAPLDPHTPYGTSHYPHLPLYMREVFGFSPPPQALEIEAYFDPAFRAGIAPEQLAAWWHEWGLRAIYAAAWQEPFPFDALLRACHQRGIRVYAWFAFPFVTRKFWDEHPHWRERTATGADGQIGWRYSMNFENPDCFRAAMIWARTVLNARPWDGVNLTELNYDADFLDYLRADRFVPMNDEVRQSYRRRAGFDPVQLFQAATPYYHGRNPGALKRFLRFREDLVFDWHRRVLEELEALRRTSFSLSGFEVIVTLLDSLHGDYVRPALGVDALRIAGLMRRFPFTLQVEDPAHFWAGPPDRYLRFARAYRKLVRDPRRLMFDVNIVPDRDVAHTALPSATAAGTELMHTLAAAAAYSRRVAIYSEHTVTPRDWVLLKTVRACRECPR